MINKRHEQDKLFDETSNAGKYVSFKKPFCVKLGRLLRFTKYL